jgi:N-acetyl sugar amidotransferase
MDTSDSNIVFDDEGVCDHCLTFEKKTKPTWNFGQGHELELDELCSKIRKSGEGKDFDCIIGMSGGVDSSYLTHLAKNVMGLRPLVFHVDAGWNSQIAVTNIERLVDTLSLDLFTEVVDWQEIRDLQLAFFKSGVPHIDTPQDHAFFATMYKFAKQHKVKYILTGSNLSTECIRNPIEWMYYQSDSTQIKDIHRKYGEQKLKTFPLSSALNHKFWLPFVKGIKVKKPLNLVLYDKENAIKLLQDTYGWESYPQKHFESRFTRFYEGYWLPEKFGFDTRRVQFSSLIVTGQMTRKEALEKLTFPILDKATVLQELDYVASKLEISVTELEGFLNVPNKSYLDYKSQHLLYQFGSSLLKAFGAEVGGKR